MYELKTKRNYDFYECSSAMQKAIRRGDEKLAGYFALELDASNFSKYVWKRLLTVSAEDCFDPITQEIMALYQAWEIVNKGAKESKGRIFISKAVLVLCNTRKCRDQDVLSNYVYDQMIGITEEEIAAFMDQLPQYEPIPEYAFDVHTKKGRMLGKTKAMFFKEEMNALEPRQPGLFDDLVE